MVGNITGKDEDETLYPLLSPPGGLFISNLLETGGLLDRGSIFHLLSTDDDISSPKKLECKVENLRDMKVEVIQPKIKNKYELPVGEQTIPDQSTRCFTVVIE